jgi:type IV pilus assembly protein PilP
MPVTRALFFMPLTLLLATAAGMAQTPQAAAHPAAAAPVAAATPATAGAAAAGAPATQTAAKETAGEVKPDGVDPQGFTYNPEGRRDPFVSLLRRGSDSSTTKRAAGLAGLGTAEVSLRGVVVSQGAFVGIVQGVDAKTYIVRSGDKLADGSIRTINADSMVILQQVNDPLSLEKVHEVRKVLRQTEEGK